MENMQELIPFAKELLSQKPSRGLLKVYLLGSVFAVLGTLVGLVEAVCQPFCSGEPLDPDMVLLLARMERTAEARRRSKENSLETEEQDRVNDDEGVPARKTTISKTAPVSQRSSVYRLHAS